MTVVQVIDVILMADGHVAALWPVLMGMTFVNRVIVSIHGEPTHNRISGKIKNSAASGAFRAVAVRIANHWREPERLVFSAAAARLAGCGRGMFWISA